MQPSWHASPVRSKLIRRVDEILLHLAHGRLSLQDLGHPRERLGLLVELQQPRCGVDEARRAELHLVENCEQVEFTNRGARAREALAGGGRKQLLEFAHLGGHNLCPKGLVLLGPEFPSCVVAFEKRRLVNLHQHVEVLARGQHHLRGGKLGIVLALEAGDAADVVADRNSLGDDHPVHLQDRQLGEGRLAGVLQRLPLGQVEASVIVTLPSEAGELGAQGRTQALGEDREVGQGHASLHPRLLGRRLRHGPSLRGQREVCDAQMA
mmetsp:Transcript_8701/g.26408  ORF Transcript_8701/g.26408 Transcript_8701/m.26408 type:complete len:266 (-) Transcript_8701:13-810(-)